MNTNNMYNTQGSQQNFSNGEGQWQQQNFQQPYQDQNYQQNQPIQQQYEQANYQPNQQQTPKEPVYENMQIFRADGKNVFVEVLRSGFAIGKVILNFIEYNTQKSAGSRVNKNVMIYLDIPLFLQIAQDFKSGRYAALSAKALETAKNGGYQYAKEIYTHLGGVSAKNLASRGKSRPDGKSISRQFKITPGMKQPWILSGEIGMGEENEKGLIVPRGRPEKIIRVPLTTEIFKQLILITEVEIQAHFNALAVERLMKK